MKVEIVHKNLIRYGLPVQTPGVLVNPFNDNSETVLLNDSLHNEWHAIPSLQSSSTLALPLYRMLSLLLPPTV